MRSYRCGALTERAVAANAKASLVGEGFRLTGRRPVRSQLQVGGGGSDSE
jgi:hypothetical protein